MQAVFSYLLRMLPFVLCAFPVYALVRWLLLRRMTRCGTQTTLWHEGGLCMFVLFLVGLYSQAFASGGNAQGSINMIPFTVLTDTWHEVQSGDTAYFLINFVGNIVMFLPVGFFVPLLWRGITFGKTVWVGFLCSLCIELCQLLLPRGTDVDDLWLNTLGAVIGYGLYAVCRRLWPVLCAQCKVIKK